MNSRTRFRIFMRDDFTCQYCGKKAPSAELHVDHRHPKSKGGPDTDENFVTACITCNSGKSNMVIPVVYRYRNGGPKDGQTVRRRDPLPVEWIWEFADGSTFSLNDATVEALDGAERRFVFGPHHYERVNDRSFDLFQAALRSAKGEFPEGRRARLLGAYCSPGLHPKWEPAMDWHDCEQIILSFTLTIGNLPGIPGMRLSILDPDG